MAEDIRVDDDDSARIACVADYVCLQTVERLDCASWLSGMNGALGVVRFLLYIDRREDLH